MDMTGTDAEARLEALRRNSGISLDAEGDFRYRGATVAHPRVQRLFHRGVEVRPGGDVAMQVGSFWCYITCAETAFHVDRIACDTDRGWIAELRGERVIDLQGATFGYATDVDRAYLWAPALGGPARLLRPAHQVLMQILMRAGEAWFAAGGAGALALPELGAVCVLVDRAPGVADAPPLA